MTVSALGEELVNLFNRFVRKKFDLGVQLESQL